MPKFTRIRTDHSYVDAHGVTIHYSVWKAAKPKAVVQLAHGLGDHSLRYEHLAQSLVQAGYSVYADDHRGHGRTGFEQTGGDTGKLGRLGPGGLRATVDALRQFTAIVRSENPGIPLVLLGHSWGSLMAQKIINANASDYDAVVLTGTALRTPLGMNGGDLNKMHKHLGTTGYEWLSRDPKVADDFVADPLAFSADALKLFGVLDGLRLYGRPARRLSRDVPLLIMIGSEDSLGGERSVEKLAQEYLSRSRLSDVELVVYEGARHEVFNETNKDEVERDLIAWLDERVAG